MEWFGCARRVPVAALATILFAVAGCDDPSAMNKSSASVEHITQDQFGAEVTNCPLPVMVDFYATWCVPCKEFAPTLDRVAGGYAGKIKFVKVNLDESPALAKSYQVEAIPTELFFKSGKLVDRMLGAPEEADLRAKLDSLLGAR